MRKSVSLLIILSLVFWAFNSERKITTTDVQNPETVEFSSTDGIIISAHIYEISKDAPVILLCHQARYNKYEYTDIAPKLNAMGFNCVAIDQRSGGELRGHENITHNHAVKQHKPTKYLDAEQDILAAIDFVYKRYKKPFTLWGSSYSSTLALYIAAKNNKISSVVSFSPGNYFAKQKGSLIEILDNFDKPVFVTSSKKEAPGITKLIRKMDLNDKQIQFIPSGEGYHGSKALWEGQKGGEEYWQAITKFLIGIKP
jgi:pimeloyl-ACP methyl ester carboxylesterase